MSASCSNPEECLSNGCTRHNFAQLAKLSSANPDDSPGDAREDRTALLKGHSRGVGGRMPIKAGNVGGK